MKEFINKFDCYVKDTDDISITIQAGDGQTASSYFEKPGTEPVNGVVNNEYLGRGVNLKGKKLLIISMVTRINQNTEWAGILYILTTMPATEQPYKEQFDSQDNSLRYITTINFK
jgi:hypothetical protein